jgi:hypothetical protein
MRVVGRIERIVEKARAVPRARRGSRGILQSRTDNLRADYGHSSHGTVLLYVTYGTTGTSSYASDMSVSLPMRSDRRYDIPVTPAGSGAGSRRLMKMSPSASRTPGCFFKFS